MRVIAGTARRLLLNTLPGEETRPTADRIKETLFNILQSYIPGASFLDLFGGSGGIAIEALSRGAVRATIVEKNPKAVKTIQENLAHTQLQDRAQVIGSDAMAAIRRLSASEQASYDLIFLDPPYGEGLEDRALELLYRSVLAGEDTLFIVEMKLEADIAHFEEMGYKILRSKEYKTNKHVFLGKA